MQSRSAKAFPDEGAIRCRSGSMALKGNLPDEASKSFRQALALNPMMWEALEGLCALGMLTSYKIVVGFSLFCIGTVPDVDSLFPSRAPPVKRVAPLPEEIQAKPVPVATGAGFFTPAGGNAGNLFRGRGPEMAAPQPFRMGPPT